MPYKSLCLFSNSLKFSGFVDINSGERTRRASPDNR